MPEDQALAYAMISIHTLHTEGDGEQTSGESTSGFQSTPSTRRVTSAGAVGKTTLYGFQSTPSTRRVTIVHLLDPSAIVDFNPHPPHGG